MVSRVHDGHKRACSHKNCGLFSVSRPPTPTEFDFDEEQTSMTPKNSFLGRRRTPGMSLPQYSTCTMLLSLNVTLNG